MRTSLLSAGLFSAFLLLSGACAADLESGPGTGSGDGDGNGNGSGDGSGGGDGSGDSDLPPTTVCELPSFSGGVEDGYYYPEEAAVDAAVFANAGDDYSGLIIGLRQGGGVATLGPGSYMLTQAASFADCNPCVIAQSGSAAGSLEALASAGTLRIDTLDARVGGRFAGQVTGLEVVEVDENNSPGACQLSVPDTGFDVILAESEPM